MALQGDFRTSIGYRNTVELNSDARIALGRHDDALDFQSQANQSQRQSLSQLISANQARREPTSSQAADADTPNMFSMHNVTLLLLLVSALAIALVQRRNANRMRTASLTDAETGLPDQATATQWLDTMLDMASEAMSNRR